jgi:membrane-associated phospholipid phosphatase
VKRLLRSVAVSVYAVLAAVGSVSARATEDEPQEDKAAVKKIPLDEEEAATKEVVTISRTLQELNCNHPELKAAGGPCVPILEMGPVRMVRWYDIWQPLTLMVIGEAVALPVRDTTNGCHWCDYDPATGDRLNALDDVGLKLRWGNPSLAGKLSWGTLIGSAVIPAYFAGRNHHVGHDANACDHSDDQGGLTRVGRNFAIIAFAAFSADAVATAVKATAARERPYSYRLTRDGIIEERPPNAYRSFFSGHTSGAFAATVVGTHLLDLYRPLCPTYEGGEVRAKDCPEGTVVRKRSTKAKIFRIAVWAPAFLTGYLRIAADKHFITDVFGGAAAGFLIGHYVAGHVKPGALPKKESRQTRIRATAVSVGKASGPGFSVSW